METQLVRLDAPYNIILGKDGWFSLHIATLIVIKERTEGILKNASMSDTLSVTCFPVVDDKIDAGGDVWINTELEDCYVVCPEKCKVVHLRELKRIMEFCARNKVLHYTERIPLNFSMAMRKYQCEIVMPTDDNNKTITDYEVCLEFEDANGGKSSMVSAADDSLFYFYEFFDNEPPFTQFVPTNTAAIGYMAQLRDDYLRIFRYNGLRSITFTTKNKDYQWFVDKLNATKIDGE